MEYERATRDVAVDSGCSTHESPTAVHRVMRDGHGRSSGSWARSSYEELLLDAASQAARAQCNGIVRSQLPLRGSSGLFKG